MLGLARDLELLVAEIGDELEAAAERGDEAVQDVLSRDVATLNWEIRVTETPIRVATCSWVIPRRLSSSASRQPRASSSSAATAASNGSLPSAVCTALSAR
jgi:hypothetical protein